MIYIKDEYEYIKTYSKENECDVHSFTISTMTIDFIGDVVTFVNTNRDDFECEINFSDDYSFNGYYICGSDLIDHIR